MLIKNKYMRKTINNISFLRIIMIIFISLNSCSDKETISPVKKDFYSVETEGSIIFWTKNQSYCPIEIYIDNILVGTITTTALSPPNCNTYGFVTVKKLIGSYQYHAQSGQYYWDYSFEINAACNKLELQ